MIFKFLFSKKESQNKERRRAFRVAIKDLQVTVHGKTSTFTFTAKDLSASGVGIVSQAKAFQPGVLVRMDLRVGKTAVVQNLVAKVARVSAGVVGCQFEQLNKKQEAVLTKLTLNEQKRQAGMRKDRCGCAEEMAEMLEGDLTFVDPWSKKKGFFPQKDK